MKMKNATQAELIQMIRMQDELNVKYNGTDWRKSVKLGMAKFALLDEVSEMAREIRVTWAWWKKNPGPMNLDLAREEFIDILHFAMLIALYRYDVNTLVRVIEDDQDICADMGGPVGDPHNYFVKSITRFFRSVDEENICGVIGGLMNIIDVGSLLLSLEPGDVFHIYRVKNEVNHGRVDSGQTVRIE